MDPVNGNRDSNRMRRPAGPGGTPGTALLEVTGAACAAVSRTAEDTGDGRQAGAQGIFSGVSFSLHAGEVMDLTGPSGSGKSSLLTCIAQLNPRAWATLRLEGRDSSTFSFQEWRHLVAYLPQKSLLPGDTVADAIRLPYTFTASRRATAPTDDDIRVALDAVGLGDIELGRDPHDLSGGQSARVSMLRTMLTHPKVVLADEVDAGLDDDSSAIVARYMVRMAHQSGMAMIRVRHRPPDGLADVKAVLSGGTLTVEGGAHTPASDFPTGVVGGAADADDAPETPRFSEEGA